LIENAEHAFGSQSEYLQQAELIADKLLEFPSRLDFVIVGHSLGGKLAAAVSRLTGKRAFTFNSAGLNEELLNRGVPTSHICNCVINGELLTSVQEEFQTMTQNSGLKTFIGDLHAITRGARSFAIPFLERWKALERTQEFNLILFLINQLEDQELRISVASKDSQIHIEPRVDINDDNFELVTTGEYKTGGVVQLVGCIAKLIRDVQLFILPQFSAELVDIPSTRPSFRDWFGRVSQGMDDVIDAVQTFDWQLIESCGSAAALHGMEVICSSFRFELQEQIRATKQEINQRHPERPPGSVCFIGPPNGGKTTIWKRMTKQEPEPLTTVGNRFASFQYEMQDGLQVPLHAWEFQPHELESFTHDFAQAAVIVLVLDGTVQNSHTYLNDLEFLMEDRPGRGVSRLNKNTRFVIAVNKSDLPQVLARENIECLAVKLHCLRRVFYISAYKGGEIFEAFMNTYVNLASEYVTIGSSAHK
jgi:hypothetical protein